KLFGWDFQRRKAVHEALPEEKANQFEDVLMRLMAAQEGSLGVAVTPENCMQSPTVHAIVTAISRRIAVSPVHVYQKTSSQGRDAKERLPNHPVNKLLQKPNDWQTRTSYWLDAASSYVRHGKFIAWKGRGQTGPIRRLVPLPIPAVTIEQNDSLDLTFRASLAGGGQRTFSAEEIHYVRGPARDFVNGDSPIKDVETAIALEIMAEKFGATFFKNGALPLLVFTYMAGTQGFKTKEEKDQFIEDIQNAFSRKNAHRTMLVPKGIDKPTPISIENDKSQFLETRKYQRTVIAGAFGVPPHLVGDLERATFNNVEQQDSDFTLNVVMPVAQAFESAMERDLLTDSDRASGIVIRFNLDSTLRADFKSRQEGLQIQRRNGVINSNEWREREGMNPISEEDGGEDYIHESNMVVAGQEEVATPASASALDAANSMADKVSAITSDPTTWTLYAGGKQ
ncbi:MAG TPA: phage portal protein, partial [Steroidobacteraceae bacterium]|nr:phage portal protein [Steroidobacteraceae bacterium]